MYSQSKKKPPLFILIKNYHTEMKLIPVIMDYCLLQFGASKFLLGVRLHGGCLSNLDFFNVNPQISQRNCNDHYSNCLNTDFRHASDIILRVIRNRNYNLCEFLK